MLGETLCIGILVFRKLGGLFRGPHNQDFSILGSILDSPNLWTFAYGGLEGFGILASRV